MISYELAKKLKDEGFPLITRVAVENNLRRYSSMDADPVSYPFLQELIEEVLKFKELDFGLIKEVDGEWTAFRGFKDGYWTYTGTGRTPEIALASLWSKLNKKR